MKAFVPQKQLHAASWHCSSACSSRTHVRQRQQQPRAAAACKAQVCPLLLDNYDSYTYNLYQIIAEAYGGTCWVYSHSHLQPHPHPHPQHTLLHCRTKQLFSPGIRLLSAPAARHKAHALTPLIACAAALSCCVVLLQLTPWSCTMMKWTWQPYSRCWQLVTYTTSCCHLDLAHPTTPET